MNLIYDSAVLVDPISTNKGLTSHGYLVARNALLARTGVQWYVSQELGLKDEHDRPIINQRVKVYRLPEDVFSESHLASLESAPVTDDHPLVRERGVTVDTHHFLAKGHGRNIRPQGDNIAGDLVITDPALISKIQSGEKYEISVGYSCGYAPYKDGVKQVRIIANHIAVVKQGRAGPKVRIYDSKPKFIKGETLVFKTKEDLEAAMFAAWAPQATPEEVKAAKAIFMTDSAIIPTATPTAAPKESSFAERVLANLLWGQKKVMRDSEDEPEKKDDDDKKKVEDRIMERFDALDSRLAALEKAQITADADSDDDDEDDDERKKTEDADGDADEDDEDDKERKKTEDTAAALQQFARAMKPAIAKLPEKERKVANDSLRTLLGTAPAPKKTGGNAYGKIAQMSFPNKTVNDSARGDEALGDELFQKYNAQAQRNKKV